MKGTNIQRFIGTAARIGAVLAMGAAPVLGLGPGQRERGVIDLGRDGELVRIAYGDARSDGTVCFAEGPDGAEKPLLWRSGKVYDVNAALRGARSHWIAEDGAGWTRGGDLLVTGRGARECRRVFLISAETMAR